MSLRAQWLGWLALLLAVALWASFRPVSSRTALKLVVLVVVDQLRADYLERFRDQYQGGLRWLLENGAHFSDAAYRHATTVTGPGHATVSTGLHPSAHGIVGNSWRDGRGGSVYCVEDERYKTVGGPGDGVSPMALLGDTLGDTLKARHSGSRVYSFSTKDRSAVLLAGRDADGAFWYEPDCGCLVSSSYYGDSLPAWLAEYNAKRPAAAYAGEDWTKLLADEALYERMARKDRFPGERANGDSAFPHGRPEQGFEDTLAATPFSDEITLGAAVAVLRSGEIGANGATDLLALGLSATDSVGHRYGPFSQEAMDNHLRLDRALGRFIEAVDAEVGLDSTLFALTADHGAVPLVEYLQASGVVAERFDTADLWKRAEKAVDMCGAGPAAETVERASGTQLYWDVRALRHRDFAQASACLAEWLGRQRGVESVFSAERLAAGGGVGTARLFEHSFYASRSPHIQLHLKKYFYPGSATGTGHGSAHAYDREVPVLLAGSGINPGRYAGDAGPEDIAPTLRAILGLETGLDRDTRVLREALALDPN